MGRRWSTTLIVTFLLLTLILPVTAYAHGADIEYTVSTEVEIVATYDTGTPMDGGQVTIYAPDDAANPWQTGTCDAEGKYNFTPDPDIPGTWDVQVRLAGHGDIVHIDVAGGASSSGGYSALQIVLMSVCVAWGFAGTALYFRRKRST